MILAHNALPEDIMSEIRQDPTTKEWVILATARGKRPSDFARHVPSPERPAFLNSCPFCPGNENLTPPSVLEYKGESNNLPWQVRAFQNGFPAVTTDGGSSSRTDQQLFQTVGGTGRHEVIVETSIHNTKLALMNDFEVSEVLRAYRERYDAAVQIPYVKSVVVFKNHGIAAGTSLEHPHSQVIATVVVPKQKRTQYDVSRAHFDDTGRCLYSDLMTRELEAGTRVIMDTDKFVVFHPFASFRPFETWIMPKADQSSFGQISQEDTRILAQVVRGNLLKLYRGLGDPDYNLVIDSAIVGEERSELYRWHIRIIPRLTEAAGFEIGSGIFINPSLPEDTARFIRDLKV
jgi:UDPglucose--hexose-1-phosphate uridylyltransferase